MCGYLTYGVKSVPSRTDTDATAWLAAVDFLRFVCGGIMPWSTPAQGTRRNRYQGVNYTATVRRGGRAHRTSPRSYQEADREAWTRMSHFG